MCNDYISPPQNLSLWDGAGNVEYKVDIFQLHYRSIWKVISVIEYDDGMCPRHNISLGRSQKC